MKHDRSVLLALLLASACSSPATKSEQAAPRAVASSNGASPVPVAAATPVTANMSDAGPRSCLAEIGAAAAARRVAICRDVSPATHPPCNAANSCAMIDDEIARSCALFADDGPPMKGCGPDPRGMEAAADVVRRYYAALDARDYPTAWAQWGDDGRPGQSFDAFQQGFAHTRTTHVTVGALEPGDGGAGSIYQPVPVTVDATLDDGEHQRFTGTYVIRRVNDVDGSTPSQRRWHIDSATLTHAR